MIKKLGIFVLSMSILVGCNIKEVEVTENGEQMRVSGAGGSGSIAIVTLPDAQGTKCAVLLGGNKGGISCDWK